MEPGVVVQGICGNSGNLQDSFLGPIDEPEVIVAAVKDALGL